MNAELILEIRESVVRDLKRGKNRLDSNDIAFLGKLMKIMHEHKSDSKN